MEPAKKYTLQELVAISKGVMKEFGKVEQRPWGVEAYTIELTKQVGDLAKCIMAFEKYYPKKKIDEPKYKTSKAEIADELSDVLYCIMGIADHYGIDLEKVHLKALRDATKYLGKESDF